MDLAYRIQAAAKRFQEADGDKVIGYKVGCTSPLIQQKLGISHPVRGYLWESQQHKHDECLSLGSFRSLAIEGELAITLLTVDGPVDQWQVPFLRSSRALKGMPTPASALSC